MVWSITTNSKRSKSLHCMGILFVDCESNVHDLLDSIGSQTLAVRRLKFMLLEVYKCIKKVNAPLFPQFIQYKYHTLSYQNAKAGTALAQNNGVWAENSFLCRIPFMEFCVDDHGDIAHIDFNEFKAFLNTWKGPDIFQYEIPLLWWHPVAVIGFSLGVCHVLYIFIDIFIASLHVFFYLIIVYLVIALYAP